MDDLLLLLILDHVSGGAYRSVVNFVGFLVAVGLFIAHPILGILGLIIWGVLFIAIKFIDYLTAELFGWLLIGALALDGVWLSISEHTPGPVLVLGGFSCLCVVIDQAEKWFKKRRLKGEAGYFGALTFTGFFFLLFLVGVLGHSGGTLAR